MPGDLPDVYLKFKPFIGECNDKTHQGSEGWITIKSFSFGFGEQGVAGKDGKMPADFTEEEKKRCKDAHGKINWAEVKKIAAEHAAKHNAKGDKKSAEKGKEDKSKGPLDPQPIKFSKSSDIMSASLMQACHKGTKISEVVLEVCRQGGPDKNAKLPFLIMTFSEVHLKSCNLGLVTDGLPTESYEFDYKKVRIDTKWTDNATGQARQSNPVSVEFNRKQLDIQEVPAPQS